MTTPNRPPLWEVMRDAYDRAPMPPPAFRNCDDIGRFLMAAEIRALRDWLVPEPEEPLFTATDEAFAIWKERKHLRALLTAEADRAERGDD